MDPRKDGNANLSLAARGQDGTAFTGAAGERIGDESGDYDRRSLQGFELQVLLAPAAPHEVCLVMQERAQASDFRPFDRADHKRFDGHDLCPIAVRGDGARAFGLALPWYAPSPSPSRVCYPPPLIAALSLSL